MVNSIVHRPTLRVSQHIYKITNLWKFRLIRSSESGENTTLVSARFSVSWHVFKINPLFSIPRTDICFNVFSKSKAFHGIIFQGKSFTFTFCNPCNLFVNLWTFNFCSVHKVSNGFKGCCFYVLYYHQLSRDLYKVSFDEKDLKLCTLELRFIKGLW